MNRFKLLPLILIGEIFLAGVAAAAGRKTSGNSVITDDLLTGAAVSVNALSGTGRILAGNLGQISVGTMTASGRVIEPGYYSRAVSSPTTAGFDSVYSSSLTVSWSDAASSNPPGTIYKVQISTSLDYSGAAVGATSSGFSADFINLSTGTVYYGRVSAGYMEGDDSPYKDTGSTITGAGIVSPSNPVVTGVYLSSISVSWEQVDPNDGSIVEASTASDFTGIIKSSYTPNTSLTALTVEELALNTTYYLRVGTLLAASTNYADTSPPSAATHANMPAATSILSVSSISVSVGWDANSNPGNTVYEIWKATADDFSGAAQSVTAGNSFLADSLAQKTTYYFKVRAQNRAGIFTDFDSAVSTRTFSAAPGDIYFSTAGVFITSISWSWNDAADEEIYRISDSDEIIIKDNLVSNTTTWTETGLSTNTAYARRGVVVNAAGISTSALVTVYTLAAAPVSQVVASVEISSASVVWEANQNPAVTFFILEASADSFATVSESSRTLRSTATLTSLLPNTSWYFRVRAENGQGVFTSYATAVSTLTFAAVPSGLTMIQASGSSIAVAWQRNSNPADTQFEASFSSTNFVTNISTPLPFSAASAVTQINVSGLAAETTYYARVRARNRQGRLTGFTSTSYLLSPSLTQSVNPSVQTNMVFGNASLT
ncbi:MAG: fibronectin type III domain-containing protein, partial [bacterium]